MFLTFLAIDKINFPFHDIQSLVSNTNYKIAINVGSSNENWFKQSKNEFSQKAWQERIEPFLDDFAKFNHNEIVRTLYDKNSEIALFTWVSNV